MELVQFRDKVQTYRRQVGRSQQELATELGLQLAVLSRKFSPKSPANLNYREIKQIVKTLAAWHAITSQTQAQELLGLMDLKLSSFSAEEWQSPPLAQLMPLEQASNISQSLQPSISSKLLPNIANKPRAITGKLPSQPFHLIGRELDLNRLNQLLQQPEVRLLTLLGPGGTGKTRLALQVGQEVAGFFRDGVYFVDLVNISDTNSVIGAIANVLKLPGSDTRFNLEFFNNYISDKNLLLILDNFEQIVSAAPLLEELLLAATELKLLVTSRIALQLYCERQYWVSPLNLPDRDNPPSNLAELKTYSAVVLLLERISAVNPLFTLTEQNATSIVNLCFQLDGLPLALELAAARLQLLSPAALLRQLEQYGSTLLTSQVRNQAERHLTLHHTMDWSYNLLTPAEQAVFRRLAVFGRQWTLETAYAVCNVDKLGQGQFLDLLSRLVNHSLIVIEQISDKDDYYSVLETVRQYALEKLVVNGETEVWVKLLTYLDRKHAQIEKPSYLELRQYYTEVLRILQYLPDDNLYRRRLVDTVNNYCSLTLSALDYSYFYNLLEKAEQIMLKLLQNEVNRADQLRLAYLNYWFGYYNYTTNRQQISESYLQKAEKVAQELDDEKLLMQARELIARMAMVLGHYDKAKLLYDQLVAPLEKAQLWSHWISVLAGRAITLCGIGDYGAAISELEIALNRAQTLNLLSRQAYVFIAYAEVYYQTSNAVECLRVAQRGIEICRQTAELGNLALLLSYQGWANSVLGNNALVQASAAEIRVIVERPGGLTAKYLIKARVALAKLNTGEVLEALTIAKELINDPEVPANSAGKAEVHLVYGQALRRQNIAERAEIENHFKQALTIFSNAGAKMLAARTYLIWGQHLREWNEPQTAQDYYQQALAVYTEAKVAVPDV